MNDFLINIIYSTKRMKQRFIQLMALFACLLSASQLQAQAPKWMEKARQAVFSVITYDAEGHIKGTGNAFFVSEEGVALSDYALFRGASRAVAINTQGVQMPVECILGANELFDVIKFKVQIPKKIVPLTLAAQKPAVGSTVYLLPYSTQKSRTFTQGTLQAEDKAQGNYGYFTLALPLKEKMVSCPLMTAQGEVFGLAQRASGPDTATISYAMDARFAMDLQITPFALMDVALQGVGIRKALPDTEEQALVGLYMASTQLTPERYLEMLDSFVGQYPNSAEGYLRRAAQHMAMATDEEELKRAEADMDKAVSVASKQDEVRYERAKLLYNYLISGGKAYKDWSYEKALGELQQAISVNPLPLYRQLEGDLQFALKHYAEALTAYEAVNASPMASHVSFFNAAKTKELLEAPAEEVVALMDSCVARFTTPYTVDAAPYLLERAQARMNAKHARGAVADYDAYFQTVNGKVNDVFYSFRADAALQSRQYQRALDDYAKAIELNPAELTYRAELAVVNIRIGRNEEAIKLLQEALSIDEQYAEAHRLMGLAYVQMKKKAEARGCFEKAKALGDPNAEALIEKHCK